MGYSTKVYFRKDYIRKDGTCAIYLQVIIDRKIRLLPLELYWPPQFCEDSQKLCTPRFAEDPEVDDMNVILRDRVSRANDIFKYYRMANKSLTIDRFLNHWQTQHSMTDFLKFFEAFGSDKLKNKEISYASFKRYKSTLSWLRRFRSEISFSDFNEKWAYHFDNFLKKNIKSRNTDTQNTRWGYHKYMKVALKYASEIERIEFTNPYDFFSAKQKRGNWRALKIEEVKKLVIHYQETPDKSERLILRRFLFSVSTSLRLSDLYRVDPSWREGDAIAFKPAKTARFNKTVKIPLSQMALGFWNDAIREKGNKRLFADFEPQYSNRVLKSIARKLNIETNIHHHIARHTWTTLFLNNGGSVRAAQMVLDHESIKTTMRYDHMAFDQVSKETDKMEFL